MLAKAVLSIHAAQEKTKKNTKLLNPKSLNPKPHRSRVFTKRLLRARRALTASQEMSSSINLILVLFTSNRTC